MIKQINFEIDGQTIRDSLLAAAGALGMFSIARFFNGRDSDKKRLRELEDAVFELKLGVTSLSSGHESLNNILDNVQTSLRKHEQRFTNLERDFKEFNTYLHNTKHELANMINDKSLKDGIVDDIYDKMSNIEKLLEKK